MTIPIYCQKAIEPDNKYILFSAMNQLYVKCVIRYQVLLHRVFSYVLLFGITLFDGIFT